MVKGGGGECTRVRQEVWGHLRSLAGPMLHLEVKSVKYVKITEIFIFIFKFGVPMHPVPPPLPPPPATTLIQSLNFHLKISRIQRIFKTDTGIVHKIKIRE